MYCTTTDPSPTADAIRLVELARTSRAANIPGQLVSSGNGVIQPGGGGVDGSGKAGKAGADHCNVVDRLLIEAELLSDLVYELN